MIETALQRITLLEKKVGPEGRSPLFAQLAHFYLEQNRAQDALRICDAGLAHFPFYTTGHLIKGKALHALNLYAEARREFEFVLDFLPNNETIKTLLSQIKLSPEETITPVEEPYQPPQREISSTGFGIPTQQKAEPQYFYTEPEAPPPPRPEPAAPPQPSSGSSFFEKITSAPAEANFEFEPPPSAAPEAPAFAGFTFPDQPSSGFDAPAAAPASSGFEFTPPQHDLQLPGLAGMGSADETFDQFADRKRGELYGENTVTLDDYLNTPSATPAAEPSLETSDFFLQSQPELTPSVYEEPPAAPSPFGDSTPPVLDLPMQEKVPDQIEELANKLQGAKITPVINFAQKDTSTATEQDTPAGMGFVTPTLAEIYAKQGWFDDAIKAYRTLARNKPADRERFEKRIVELEELKKQSTT